MSTKFTQQEIEAMKRAEEEATVNMVPAPAIGNALNLSADKVALELDKMVADGRITTGEKGLVMWFFGLCRERGYNMTEAGKLIRYTSTTVSRLFRGSYEGNVQKVISAIRSFKQLEAERSRMMSDEFIETSVWHKIRQTCDLAILRHRPVRIVGPSQIGKTRALTEYQRRSEYLVRYCRIPAAPRFRSVVETVAEACAVSTSSDLTTMRKKVLKSLDQNTLLIVDELHELAISAGKRTAMDSVEWLRELYDRRDCGLVVCGTRTMEDDLIYGEQRGWLDQFDQRCSMVLNIPLVLPDADINLITQRAGMPAPSEIDLEMLRTLRMSRLMLSLNLTADIAERRGIDKTWDLFRSALATVRGDK